ncbi:DUF6221 family protein [Streptomyces aurantiogriseus]
MRWLGEQLDEDERIARTATQGPWSVDSGEYAEAIYAADRTTAVVAGGRWGGEASVFESTEDALHIAAHDPVRVLREIDAKRQLLTTYEAAKRNSELPHPEFVQGVYPPAVFVSGYASALEYALRLLVLVYGDRPGYREEWRP